MAEGETQPIKQEDTAKEDVENIPQIKEEPKVVEEVQIKVEKTEPDDTIIKAEPTEQPQQDTKVNDEVQIKIEKTEDGYQTKQENQTVEETQVKVEEPQQGDTVIKEEPIEQAQQGDETQVKTEEIKQEGKTDASTEINPQSDKISENEEEIQKIMDLEQAPSYLEAVFENKFMYEQEGEQEMQSLQVIMEDEEFQTAMFNIDGLYPFTSPDGLITPPPSPAEDGSNADEKESDVSKVKSTKSTKSKQKRAGFKIGSINEAVSEHKASEYGSANKVVTGVKDLEEQKQLAECTRYAGFEKFASHFVDKIIDKSINSVVDRKMYTTQFGAEDASTLSSYQTFVEIFGTFTKWPRIQEFSKDIGENVLSEYMQTWEYNEEWMYCIDFLLEQSDECSEFYLYEARWSIPSKPYPIPQATASIYFTIEVSRVKPPFCPVDVTYVFEGSRTVHIPGKIPFQESLLFNIIDSKLEMYKRIKF